MAHPDVDHIYEKAAAGNGAALNFLNFFHSYCHEIDDFVDKETHDPKVFLPILAHANIVYSCPYYVAHAARLQLIVAQLTNAWADSLEWGGSDVEWKRQWADLLRFSGNDMVLAVAMIEGGFSLMRQLSLLLRETAWLCHHKSSGESE